MTLMFNALRFGRVKFRIFVLIFSTALACREHQKICIWNLTRPNRWAKCQFISKYPFGVFNSTKSEQKQFNLRYYSTEVEFFHSFFGRIGDTINVLSKSTNLYQRHKKSRKSSNQIQISTYLEKSKLGKCDFKMALASLWTKFAMNCVWDT